VTGGRKNSILGQGGNGLGVGGRGLGEEGGELGKGHTRKKKLLLKQGFLNPTGQKQKEKGQYQSSTLGRSVHVKKSLSKYGRN